MARGRGDDKPRRSTPAAPRDDYIGNRSKGMDGEPGGNKRLLLRNDVNAAAAADEEGEEEEEEVRHVIVASLLCPAGLTSAPAFAI